MAVFQVAAGVLLGKVLYDLLEHCLSMKPFSGHKEKPVERKAASKKKPATKRKAKKE